LEPPDISLALFSHLAFDLGRMVLNNAAHHEDLVFSTSPTRGNPKQKAPRKHFAF